MSIDFLNGFSTYREAENHRQDIKHDYLFSVATVYKKGTKEALCSFVIQNSAIDLIMAFDENAEAKAIAEVSSLTQTEITYEDIKRAVREVLAEQQGAGK